MYAAILVPELERRQLSTVPVVVWGHQGWVSQPAVVSVTLEGPAAELERINVDEVVAFVHIPDQPERVQYEAAWGPREGVRLRVLQGVGENVEVVRVEPSRVEAIQR